MIEIVLVYEDRQGRQVDIITARDNQLIEEVAHAGLNEYRAAALVAGDPVVHEMLLGKVRQARRALEQLGVIEAAS